MKPSSKVVATAAAAAVVVVVVMGGRMAGKDRPGSPAGRVSEAVAVAPEVPRRPFATTPRNEPASAASPEAAAPPPDESTTASATDADAPEDTHYYNGMDPDLQPRKILHITLAGMRTVPDGYETTGDFHLAQGGWTLAPPAPGEEARPRIAMIESPPLTLDFQSNAVNPLWKEVSPDGTEVLVEVSLSQDGANWTDWMPTTSGHYEGGVSPTFPDGRPNPNYGYTLGDMTFYGLTRFQFFRYAVTMYSETDETPVVSDFRLFYQDSTMGDADLVQTNVPTAGGAVQ